jgi:PAS domain-containing protein
MIGSWRPAVRIEDETRDATLQRLLEELERLRSTEEQLSAEVAELREAVLDLEEARHYQLDAYDLAPIACLTLDRHGTIRNANRRACSVLCFSKQQLTGVPLLALLTLAHRRRFLEHVLASRKSPEPSAFEVLVAASEREPVAVRLSIRWTEESGGSYAVCLIDLRERDIALADYQRLVEAARQARVESSAKDRLIEMLNRGVRSHLSAGRQSRTEIRHRVRTKLPARSQRRHRALR